MTRLYHGTAARHLPTILRDGLRPRGRNGASNWKHSIESNPDTIYLTNAYALHFAYQATKADSEEAMAVLELDTDWLPYLVPDEDWLEQVSRKQEGLVPPGQNRTMKARTRWFRKNLDRFSAHWTESLDGLGTCGHQGAIPPDAITRHRIVTFPQFAELTFRHGIDPMVTVMNYKICGPRYRNSLRWLFGDTEALETDLFGDTPFKDAPAFAEVSHV